MQKLVVELEKQEADSLVKLQLEHPESMICIPLHSIDGSEWLSFTIDMTKALAPHVFALLTILVTAKKKIIVIQDGKRKELSQKELDDIKIETDAK